MEELSDSILRYRDWLKSVQVFVEDAVVLAIRNPGDPTYHRDTDDMTVNGISLKGQDIEISRITGNVFIRPDIFTFAEWLKQV